MDLNRRQMHMTLNNGYVRYSYPICSPFFRVFSNLLFEIFNGGWPLVSSSSAQRCWIIDNLFSQLYSIVHYWCLLTNNKMFFFQLLQVGKVHCCNSSIFAFQHLLDVQREKGTTRGRGEIGARRGGRKEQKRR